MSRITRGTAKRASEWDRIQEAFRLRYGVPCRVEHKGTISSSIESPDGKTVFVCLDYCTGLIGYFSALDIHGCICTIDWVIQQLQITFINRKAN